MNSNQRNDPLSCVYVLGTKWGREVGWGSHIHLSPLWVLFRVSVGSISHGREILFCNTSAHFHLSHHSGTTFIVSRFGLFFSSFLSVVSTHGGSSLSLPIIVIRGSHMLAKLYARQMVLCQATFYHIVKVNFFFRKCEIKWTYCIL